MSLRSAPGGFISNGYNPFAVLASGAPATVEYLVVAGGAGGGSSADNGDAGAGGAGGLLTGTDLSVTAGTTYTITVGAGGAINNAGGASSIGALVTTVGGGIGGSRGGNGASGGSGGGVGYLGASGGAGTSGQGYAGSSTWAGYGGGAGGVGTSSAPGPGVASTITGSSVTYARGGNYTDTSVPANSGYGGTGGSGHTAGGSGVVIIRYPSNARPATATGTVATIVVPGYYVYKFTGSGTITF